MITFKQAILCWIALRSVRQARSKENVTWFWFPCSGLRNAAFSIAPLFLFLFQVGFFPGECVELINEKLPESLINSVPKPGTDVTFDGAGKQSGVFFGVCSVFNSSLIHPTLSSVLMILHAYHGDQGPIQPGLGLLQGWGKSIFVCTCW